MALSTSTIQIINDLKNDLNDMLSLESNIEVLWKLEEFQNQKAFQKSADFIRKSLNTCNPVNSSNV